MRLRHFLLGFFVGFLLTFFARNLLCLLFVKCRSYSEWKFIKSYKIQPSVPEVKHDKILCWVMTLKVLPEDRFRIGSTWGKRCDKLIFVAKTGEPSEDTIISPYELLERMDLWNQAHRAWARIAERFMHEYDWFIKLDTDSFFLPENFRYVAKIKNWRPENVVYFGHTVYEQTRPEHEIRAQFNLGAGYGVSRFVLQSIYPYLPTARESTLPVDQRCPEWVRWGEDVKFADCMRYKFPTLVPNKTRDVFDREHFVPFTPNIHFKLQFLPWFYRGKEKGLEQKQKSFWCCSARPALWHGIKEPYWNPLLDYLHYVVAVDPIPPPPPPPPSNNDS